MIGSTFANIYEDMKCRIILLNVKCIVLIKFLHTTQTNVWWRMLLGTLNHVWIRDIIYSLFMHVHMDICILTLVLMCMVFHRYVDVVTLDNNTNPYNLLPNRNHIVHRAQPPHYRKLIVVVL